MFVDDDATNIEVRVRVRVRVRVKVRFRVRVKVRAMRPWTTLVRASVTIGLRLGLRTVELNGVPTCIIGHVLGSG